MFCKRSFSNLHILHDLIRSSMFILEIYHSSLGAPRMSVAPVHSLVLVLCWLLPACLGWCAYPRHPLDGQNVWPQLSWKCIWPSSFWFCAPPISVAPIEWTLVYFQLLVYSNLVVAANCIFLSFFRTATIGVARSLYISHLFENACCLKAIELSLSDFFDGERYWSWLEKPWVAFCMTCSFALKSWIVPSSSLKIAACLVMRDSRLSWGLSSTNPSSVLPVKTQVF